MINFHGKAAYIAVKRNKTSNTIQAIAAWFETHPRIAKSLGVSVVVLAMASLVLVATATSKFTGV